MDGFVNEFALNMQMLPSLIVFVVLGLPIFGYFYNKLMDNLSLRGEHTSLYVAIGCFVVLVFGALISWRASLMFLALFALAGFPMIVGEFKRTEERKQSTKTKNLRRKRLPYAANGMIADAEDAAKEVQRLIGVAMKYNGKNIESAIPLAEATSQINLALTRLMEVKVIQQVDE